MESYKQSTFCLYRLPHIYSVAVWLIAKWFVVWSHRCSAAVSVLASGNGNCMPKEHLKQLRLVIGKTTRSNNLKGMSWTQLNINIIHQLWKKLSSLKMPDSTENAKNRCLKMEATAPNMNAFEGFHEYRLRTTIAHNQIFGHFHCVARKIQLSIFFSSSLVYSSALHEMNRQTRVRS